MRNKFFLTAGMVGMLSGVASGATDGSDVGYGREWSPYVTLRGGWLFGGKTKYHYHWNGRDPGMPPAPDREVSTDTDRNFGSAWSGSGEVGVSLCEDRVSVGLELGYFAGKKRVAFMENGEPGIPNDYCYVGVIYFSEPDCYYRTDGKCKNLFAAVNVTLKKDVAERAFLYGGVGAGMARSDFGSIDYMYHQYQPADEYHEGKINFKAKWRFLTQAFAGLGWYLNDNWSLTVGYRLRYLAGSRREAGTFVGDNIKWDWKVKRDSIHAVEAGLTYRF